jgi:hypothetical protein
MHETISTEDTEVLAHILTALRTLDLQIDALKAQSAPLRTQARDILRGRTTITIPGIGTARDVPDSIQATYDRVALDTLVVRLAAIHPDIAATISATRKEKTQRGYLWIACVKEEHRERRPSRYRADLDWPGAIHVGRTPLA